MTRIAFDTLRYSQRLKATGMSDREAVALAEAMAEALGDLASSLVTQDQLRAELADIRSTLRFHSWVLGLVVVTNLIPLLRGG